VSGGRNFDAQVPPGTKLLDRLAEQALIDPDQRQAALLHAQQVSCHCMDAVVETGAMVEAELLKYLANMYRTRFVSTAKLAKASINKGVLQKVPYKLARRLQVCPILYSDKTSTLSVVAADLAEHDIGKQVQMVGNVREVRVFLALPATVDALIRKHYKADSFAFTELEARTPGGAPTLGIGGPAGGADFGTADAIPLDLGSGVHDHPSSDPVAAPSDASARPAPALPSGIPSPIEIPVPIAIPKVPRKSKRPVAITMDSPKVAAAEKESVKEAAETLLSRDFREALNVLVALLEQGRGDLRGHSAQVARLCRRVGERIGLSEAQLHGVLIAAFLHDIGKAGTYHLTALNVAQYEGHRIQAQKTYLNPVKMFESVKLPEATVQTLSRLYERTDGQGFPDRLARKDIPLGARILAIVESYCDITTHEKNPFRRVLKPKEACEALERNGDKIFDANLIDVFRTVVLGDDLKAKLLADRPTLLVVDSDPEETTVLELRLIEQGYDVEVARTATDAYERVQKGGVDGMITEVELAPIDGFELLSRLRKGGEGAELPVLFLTAKDDGDSVNHGLELGAADYIVKPVSAEVVAAKTKRMLNARKRDAPRGVSGSLAEMSLPDVVQVLSNGRKSGQLRITSEGQKGDIFFSEGAIWDATFGDARAEEAFYAMLVLEDGDFSLDPQGRAKERVVNAPTESLLLEGMRRLDEGRR